MEFKGNEYSKLTSLKDKILQHGEIYDFHVTMQDKKPLAIETIDTSYPHTNEKKYWETTLVTLYLHGDNKEGHVTFISQSEKPYQKAVQAVRKLIKDPEKEVKLGIETILVMA